MNRDLKQLTDQHFDVLVCGGGIYGAWTAYDAALRGLKVALLEQHDWASGTSSASSKLVHGGLRYLETLDIKLVKKALQERQRLLNLAPHRVWPLRFGIPVFRGNRLGSLKIKLGLLLYDALAGIFGQDSAHRHFGRQAFSKRFPCLAAEQLLNGYTYQDAQTDDARYVLEIISGALAAGAICVNYCQVNDIRLGNNQRYTANFTDTANQQTGQLTASKVVKTLGQWAAYQSDSLLSKGVHLIMPNLLNAEALLLTAPQDGRVFFMIPWYGRTLLGTTDTLYSGDINQIEVNDADRQYLLDAANSVLKSVKWSAADIIGQCAGLRVLKQNTKSTPSAASRDWLLKTTTDGILISVGGKLTSAREDAAQIVNTLCEQLGLIKSCPTAHRPFPWSPAQPFTDWYFPALSQAINLGLDKESAHYLLTRHGQRVTEVFEILQSQPATAARLHPDVPLIEADLLYCADQEMVVHLDDLLRRRMPLLLLMRLSPTERLRLAGLAGSVLAWNVAKIAEESARCSVA